jgi:hypothetical protein
MRYSGIAIRRNHKESTMNEQYDPLGRYNVIGPDGVKIGEVRKGVLYEGAPEYDEEYGTITYEDDGEGLTFVHNGAVFELIPQDKA